jgi:hypothetical protein
MATATLGNRPRTVYEPYREQRHLAAESHGGDNKELALGSPTIQVGPL